MSTPSHLSLTEPHSSDTGLPDFEGHEVTMTKAKITSVAGLEIDDNVFHLDQSVKLIVETRVISVQHVVDAATGKLERVHVLKAHDSQVIDWAMDMDALRSFLA